MNHLPRAILCLLPLALTACRSSDPEASRLYDGYGGYHRAVSGASSETQVWIDQGLQLVYGFNHDEALRSFRKAAELDPDCAMAWWGIAYANGIDVNDVAMSETASAEGYQAIQEALRHVEAATPAERALVEAQAARFAWPAPEDRASLDEAYAEAMGRAWAAHTDDPDVGALYAEALMVLQPWDYWNTEGEPQKRALEIVDVIERCLELNPMHPGANHFYIHAVEASPDPARAVAAAERLEHLVPGSGHLVHMPSHVYINVGRYGDAAAANERAIAADEAYFELAPPPDFYSLYYVHNLHFLAFAAMMDGRSEVALDAARQIEAKVPPQFLEGYVKIADGLMPTVLHVLIRFGRWEEVLDVADYPESRLASRSIRHYARAVAFANLERTEEARESLAALDAAIAEMDDEWMIGVNPAPVVLAIARGMAEGEILYREGAHDAAFVALRAAVAAEDALVYDEPPGWMQPVRHALGALLLASDRATEAEEVYTVDLDDNRENAWSLLGLDQCLRVQGKAAAADALKSRLEAAWARADVDPPASCYCGVAPEAR